MIVQAPVKNVTLVCPRFSSYERKACTVVITHGTNLRLQDNVNDKERTTKVAGKNEESSFACFMMKIRRHGMEPLRTDDIIVL